MAADVWSLNVRFCYPPASTQANSQLLATEGDHIKVTASKFPFPTVCADKQSTDWFHAISRTLKWNERERQKSFVVVEESSAKERQPRSHKSGADGDEVSNENDSEEEEEEEEEEERFDIDDLSSESSDAAPPAGDGGDSGLGTSASTSPSSATATRAAEAIMGMSPAAHAKARARSRSRSGVRSGVDSPSRFAPVPPRHSPGQGHGHVHWAAGVPNNAKNISSPIDGGMGDIATPTAAVHGRRMRSHSPGHVYSHQHPRAFAVWGQDESDSNSSDDP